MLTPEEKTEQAKQISSLYPTPKPASELGPHLKQSKSVDANVILQQGVILGGVTSLAFVVVVTYLRLFSGSSVEAAQAGILFIVLSLGATLALVKGLQHVRKQLSLTLIYSTGTFFVSLTTMFVLCGVLFNVLFADSHMNAIQVWVRLGISVGVIIAGAILSLLIATRLFERNR